MTTSERNTQMQKDAHPPVPGQAGRRLAPVSHGVERRPVVLHGRPRTVEGEEAYLRSAMEQAATDIAAGW